MRASDIETENIALVKRFLAALESFASGTNLTQFLTDDAVQEEFPNPVMPRGARRNLADIEEAVKRRKVIMRAERYEVRDIVAYEDKVAVEAMWVGTLSVPFGALPAGSDVRGHLGMFFELEDGKIATQRIYACYEPW